MIENSQYLPIGHKIGHHYEIIEVLGQGGFGIVYLVKDTHRVKDNIFVIKELFVRSHSFRHRGNTTVGTSQKIKNIFEKIKTDIIREVDILSSITNSNIVQAYGYIEENRTIYSIMEHIMGDDLEEYIKKNSFDEDMAMDLLKQLINGLEEIHSQNIIHRDLKTSNIMRTKEGVYKIIDFTTNKSYSDKDTNITNINSEGYTAPELTQTRATIGAFSDIYAIGMTMYNVLSLENPPSLADRFDDKYFQKSIDELSISTSFKKNILRMTSRDAKGRFRSLEELTQSIIKNNNIEEFDKNLILGVVDEYSTVRCKFNYKIEKTIPTFITGENKVEEIVEPIKEESDFSLKKILLFLIGTLLLGIGYLLFSLGALVDYGDSSQSEIVVEKNDSVRIKNNDELNQTLTPPINENFVEVENNISLPIESIVPYVSTNTYNIPKEKVESLNSISPNQERIATRVKLNHWADSDGLYLGKTLVLTFKKNKITLNRGFCKEEGIKWVCIVPKKQILKFKDITSKLGHQKFAKSIFLNMDKSNSNVRVIITLKDGYKAKKERINGKSILIFDKKERES